MARVIKSEENMRSKNIIDRVISLKGKGVDDEFTETYKEFINLLNTRILNVVFIKKNGKERHMRCNRSGGADIADIEKRLVKVYDLEKEGYRSFTIDSIKEITIE